MLDIPGRLQCAFRKLHLSLTCSPISRTLLGSHSGPHLFGFPFFRSKKRCRILYFLSAQSKECPVRMEHRQVALEVINKIEFHFGQFSMVGWEVLDVVLFLCKAQYNC